MPFLFRNIIDPDCGLGLELLAPPRPAGLFEFVLIPLGASGIQASALL